MLRFNGHRTVFPVSIPYRLRVFLDGDVEQRSKPMKVPNAVRWLLLLILITGCSRLLAQTATHLGAPGATIWGDAVNGLEISIFFDPQQTGTKPQLRIGLRNVGSSAIDLTLGSGCGAGKPEPNMITLVLTDDQGKSQRLTDIGPEPSLDPCTALASSSLWRETLAPSASFSIPINVDYYKNLSRFTVSDLLAVKDGQQLKRGWEPGRTYSVQAEFPIGPAAKDPHIVKSNQLRVHFPAEQQ